MKFQFDSWQSFMAMGTHGPYVWSVVVITLIVLTALVWLPLKSHARALKEQQRLIKIAQARQAQHAARPSE